MVIVEIGSPPHKVCVTGLAATVGLGFTITVTVVVLVPQLPELAVIVKIVLCCTLVILVKFPVIFVPLPLAPIPVRLVVLSLVQL